MSPPALTPCIVSVLVLANPKGVTSDIGNSRDFSGISVPSLAVDQLITSSTTGGNLYKSA